MIKLSYAAEITIITLDILLNLGLAKKIITKKYSFYLKSCFIFF